MKYHCLTACFFLFYACAHNSGDKPSAHTASEPEASGSITLDGTELTWSARGSGMPFLVVGSSPDYFSDSLQNHFRLYFIDTRATAEHYHPIDTASYSRETLLQDIDTLRAAMGLDRFVIGGHSIMGAIALEYARKHPDRVSHVVMIGTPRFFGTAAFQTALTDYWATAPEERKQLYEAKQEHLKEISKDMSPQEAMITGLLAESPKRWHDPDFDATPFLQKIHFNMDFAGHLFGKLFPAFDLCEAKESLNIPVFVATGKSDYVSPPTLWEGPCEQLPGLTVSLFEESGHTPHFEQSALFNQRLIAWVSQ